MSVGSISSRRSGSAPRRIAVVGSGISGLSAAWLLSTAHHDVTVYEKSDWVGGHSHTVDVDGPDGPIAVDTGFIVFNEANYPNLSALFAHLGVATKASNMSFAASIGGGRFEYSSADLNTLVGQRSNLVSLRFWRMMRDILRFYAEARSLAEEESWGTMTLGAFLDARGYSSALVADHVLPMCAAIWSTSPAQIQAFPLSSFVRFFSTHGLLNLGHPVTWRTVEGGSRAYVERLMAPLGRRPRTSVAARAIARGETSVIVEDESGKREAFDDVIIAAHADEALWMLDDPSPEETRLLGAFRYTNNVAVLHSDARLMPRRPRVWSSWNFIGEDGGDKDRALCVTYWMNRLQGLDPRRPTFVTLNPVRDPRPESVEQTFDYSHPLLDADAIAAQEDLWSLQGRRRTWFCGSYFGYGFHEDGLQSGLAVAEALGGVRRPWNVADESGRITLTPPLVDAAE